MTSLAPPSRHPQHPHLLMSSSSQSHQSSIQLLEQQAVRRGRPTASRRRRRTQRCVYIRRRRRKSCRRMLDECRCRQWRRSRDSWTAMMLPSDVTADELSGHGDLRKRRVDRSCFSVTACMFYVCMFVCMYLCICTSIARVYTTTSSINDDIISVRRNSKVSTQPT